MKRRDLIKKLKDAGFVLARNGANHDVYVRGNVTEPIPRHNEIGSLQTKCNRKIE